MPSLPPGPAFVLSHLPAFLAPPVATALTAYAIRRLSGIHLPVWLVVVACLASFPVSIFGRSAWADVKARRTAAVLGADVPILANKKDVKPSGETKFPRTCARILQVLAAQLY